MRAVVAAVKRVENAVRTGRIFMRRDFPGQQPRAFNAVRVHVGDEIGIVAVMPENMLVGVDETSRLRHEI